MIVEAVREAQAAKSTPIRLWVVSGQVLLYVPALRAKVGDFIPIHPEHHNNYAFLLSQAKDIDWSLLCPGRITDGEVCFDLHCQFSTYI